MDKNKLQASPPPRYIYYWLHRHIDPNNRSYLFDFKSTRITPGAGTPKWLDSGRRSCEHVTAPRSDSPKVICKAWLLTQAVLPAIGTVFLMGQRFRKRFAGCVN